MKGGTVQQSIQSLSTLVVNPLQLPGNSSLNKLQTPSPAPAPAPSHEPTVTAETPVRFLLTSHQFHSSHSDNVAQRYIDHKKRKYSYVINPTTQSCVAITLVSDPERRLVLGSTVTYTDNKQFCVVGLPTSTAHAAVLLYNRVDRAITSFSLRKAFEFVKASGAGRIPEEAKQALAEWRHDAASHAGKRQIRASPPKRVSRRRPLPPEEEEEVAEEEEEEEEAEVEEETPTAPPPAKRPAPAKRKSKASPARQSPAGPTPALMEATAVASPACDVPLLAMLLQQKALGQAYSREREDMALKHVFDVANQQIQDNMLLSTQRHS